MVFDFAAGNKTCFPERRMRAKASDARKSKEKQMAELALRKASLDDMGALWALMKQTAADIPCPIETESEQERGADGDHEVLHGGVLADRSRCEA